MKTLEAGQQLASSLLDGPLDALTGGARRDALLIAARRCARRARQNEQDGRQHREPRVRRDAGSPGAVMMGAVMVGAVRSGAPPEDAPPEEWKSPARRLLVSCQLSLPLLHSNRVTD